MTQPRPNKPPTKTVPLRTTKSSDPDQIPVDGERFEILWLQFEDEAGFSTGRLDDERAKLQQEIAVLEAKIAEKKSCLQMVENQVDADKHQLKVLLSAKLSADAILTAMRVEYKNKRSAPKPKKDDVADSPADEDKQFVLDQLDAEGLSISDLRKLTGKDARTLRITLEALVAEGKISKTGDRANAKYHLV